MLLLFFVLRSYLKFFISPACGLVISILFLHALAPRRTFELLQGEFFSSLFGEELLDTEMGFHDFV